MSRYLEFEIYIADLLETKGLRTSEDLEEFSDTLHTSIENAFNDYATDYGIGDYEQQY